MLIGLYGERKKLEWEAWMGVSETESNILWVISKISFNYEIYRHDKVASLIIIVLFFMLDTL